MKIAVSAITVFIPMLLMVSLSSCVQVNPIKQVSEHQLSVSSARDSQKKYPAGSRFSVSAKYIDQTAFTPEQLKNVYSQYQQEIINNLTEHGYQYYLQGTAAPADFEVVYGIASSQDLTDELIIEKFGISPGLQETAELNKGSFLMYIQDLNSQKRIWRGAAQGFILEDLSEQERTLRAKNIVNVALSSFY